MKNLLISSSLSLIAFCASVFNSTGWATNLTDDYAKRGELAAAARYAAEEGRFDQAEELLIKALSFCEKKKLPSQSISKLKSLLEVCDHTGHYEKCSAAYRRSLALGNDLYSQRELLPGLIDSLVEEGKYREAFDAIDALEAKFKPPRFPYYAPFPAHAERAILLFRMGRKAQAQELLKESGYANFNKERLRRYRRLIFAFRTSTGPRQSIIVQKISQEASLFPNAMAFFEMGKLSLDKKLESKAIDYWKQSVTCKTFEQRDQRFGGWSEEDSARRRAAVGLIELYERRKNSAEVVELCKYTIAKIRDMPGSLFSNVVVNEHLTSNLIAQKNTGDALKNLHEALSVIANEEKVESKRYVPSYFGSSDVREGNFDFQVKLCAAAKLFDQTLNLSKSLRAQNKLSDAQALMEHLVSVPGKEFYSVTNGDSWIEELSRIYIAQKNYQKAETKLLSILSPVSPLMLPKDDIELKRALAIIASFQIFRLADDATWDVPPISRPEFQKYTTRLELLQGCYRSKNDIKTVSKLYKQHALFLEMTLDDANPRLAQRLDFVAERLSSQCHDPSAINYHRKAAAVAERILENQERFVVGVVVDKQPYDTLQVLKNYQQALERNGQKGESSEVLKTIAKFEMATKAGQMNGKKAKVVPTVYTTMCGNDPMIAKIEKERLLNGRETMRKIVEAADRQQLR